MKITTFLENLLRFMLLILLGHFSQVFGSCRTLQIRTILKDKELTNHTIRTIKPITDAGMCRAQCFLESLCFGVNFCFDQEGTAACELANSDHIRSGADLVQKSKCTFYGSESGCSSNPCASNATCQADFLQDAPSYRCICPAGYTGQMCQTEIDECAFNMHDCHVYANCTNNYGGYNCTCKTGFYGNGTSCDDIDECALGIHGCSDELVVCTNLPGGHECTCKAGFQGDGKECVDLDECALNVHECHVNATCNNTYGGHDCTCKKGFHGNGKTCHDIDECSSDGHGCHVNATCINTIGGHTCQCQEGLYGNGSFCRYPKNCDEVASFASTTGFYMIKENQGLVYRFCEINNKVGCGDGIWTLVMKIDGEKVTFEFNSKLWKNSEPYNKEAMYSGMQKTETKQTAFWNKPVQKLCLGMTYAGVTNWISTSLQASSLLSAISNKKTLAFGRQKWLSLLSPVKLENHCNKEGFEEPKCEGVKHVISFWTNNRDHCNDCDSSIGFGGTNPVCGDFHESSGERAAFCYILIQ